MHSACVSPTTDPPVRPGCNLTGFGGSRCIHTLRPGWLGEDEDQAHPPPAMCRDLPWCVCQEPQDASPPKMRLEGSGHSFIGQWMCDFLAVGQAERLGRAGWVGRSKEPGRKATREEVGT